MSKRLWAAIAALAAMLSLAGIAGAGTVPRMGDQSVGLFECAFGPTGCSEVTLAADEPFHVAHGWGAFSRKELVDPTLRFELSVDGIQKHGAIDFNFDPDAAGLLGKFYVFNFPRGMSGTHSFTGCWFTADGSPPTCGTRIVHFV